MNSDILKNAVLEHFRFKRNYHLCATEVRCNNQTSDIMITNGKEIVDIEIKISYSDFLADFKKRKHTYFLDTDGYNYQYLYANKLYYCVPAEIEKQCLLYLAKNNLPYGLISFNGVLTFMKTCRKINKLSENLINMIRRKMILRLSSEMIFLRNHKICEKCGHINKPDLVGKVFI